MADMMLWASSYFLDPKMVYALGLVLLFIILYLIRPKPKYQVLPTLMFLFKDAGRSRTSNFLRQLITNLLFLLQLLIIVSITLALAKPYINVSKEALFKNTVLVVDVSASMNAPYEGGTRFEKAVSLAKDNLGSINTLILVKKVPEAVLVDETAGKVKSYLSKLKAGETPTNLYAAISAAGSYAKADSRIVVISDFIDTNTDTDLNTIKKTLESQGIKVDFLRVFSQVPNVGIVELSVSESKTTAVIKNFNKEPVTARLKINDLTEDLSIKPESREVFTFTTPPRTSKLELETIEGQDKFKNDNTAYISAPSDVAKKALLITNKESYSKMYLYNALDVMKSIDVQVAIPPKIPSLTGYDIFIFKDIDPNLVLPGTFKGVKEEVEEKGKAAIIVAQPTMTSINYQGLMPVSPRELAEQPTSIIPSGADPITSNIEFGITKRYFLVDLIDDVKTVDLAKSDDNNPLISYYKLGNGNVIYYGIMDEDAQSEAFFGKSPAYFVFWKRTVDFITNTPAVKNLNFKTGNNINFAEEQTIQTPNGKITAKDLPLDNQGLYTLKDRIVAINLADELESAVSNEPKLSDKALVQSGERFKEKVPFELTDYLIWLALIVLLLELLYIKFRGDF